MFNISGLDFGSAMPIITISKDGNSFIGDNYIGNTHATNRNMSFKRYNLLFQGFLKCQFNGGIAMWLWLLPKSRLATSFSTGFIKLTKTTNLSKLISLFLPYLVAIPRAISLITLTRANGWSTAHGAYIKNALAKACQFLALVRAIALRCFRAFTIKRLKVVAAIRAYPDSFHSHTYITPQIEEKYCEIAARRCSQSVMRLNV